MKYRVKVRKDGKGRLTQILVYKGLRRRPIKLDFEYGDDGYIRDVFFEGRRDELPKIPEILDLVNEGFIERIGTIRQIDKVGIDIWHDRGMIKQWLHDGVYTERWEQGFRKELYHGRTGAYYKSESEDDVDFEDWTLPEIVEGVNNTEPSPWNNALRMRNSMDGSTVDEIYVGFPKAHHRQVMAFEAKFSSPSGNSPRHHFVGFEVNSGGSFAWLACLMCEAGQWKLKKIGYDGNADANLTLRHPDVFARYCLILDPPYLELWEAPSGDPDGFPLEKTTTLDLGALQGKAIPFFANEDWVNVTEFLIGNVWIYEILPRPIHKTQTWTEPYSNPSLTLNVAGRQHVAVWARSEAAATVLVQVSHDGSTFRDLEELTTASLNGIYQVYKVFQNAWRYFKVTVEETATDISPGTAIIDISASAK